MAAVSQSQHRCVFVGNIPYDASEEQLIQICEEVGPVVSFRLVTDRETGKPKGYGFCEYKDEETALSARRNLQGYEVNGRQLRVDFAENDKNPDRNREQGRGGPGIVTNTDPQKQFGGPTVVRDHSLHQPVGDSVAMVAATAMAGALGSAQTAQAGQQSQTLPGTDPLTRHLAKMSRSQLTEIMSELKAMATQDKEQARRLLLTIPNLTKALFQAQIMLGMVTPQMLQMTNVRQASAQPVQPLMQSIQTLPGLPPLPQNKTQFGLLPYAHESQVPDGVSNSNPYAAVPPLPTPSQIQHPQLVQNQVLQQGLPLSQPGVSSIPSVRPQSLGGLPFGTHLQALQQFQSSLSQNVVQVPPINSAYHAISQTSSVMRPQSLSESYQPLSTSSAMPDNMDLKGRVSSLPANTRMVSDSIDQMNRPSKMIKLNDGRTPSQVNIGTPISAPSPTTGLSGRQTAIAQETLNSGRQVTQMQLPSDVDSALLQQVLSLTPEQLNSLPPDQQQQVIQLQQMLRQAA